MFDRRHTKRQIFYKQNGEEVYVDMMMQKAALELGKTMIFKWQLIF